MPADALLPTGVAQPPVSGAIISRSYPCTRRVANHHSQASREVLRRFICDGAFDVKGGAGTKRACLGLLVFLFEASSIRVTDFSGVVGSAMALTSLKTNLCTSGSLCANRWESLFVTYRKCTPLNRLAPRPAVRQNFGL